MRNIPVFTTDNGVASLTLTEIPYSHTAYIRIQDTANPGRFLKECCDFCRAAGAERVFATGHDILNGYPVSTKIVRMCCTRDSLPDTDAALFPVQKTTLEQWRALYNNKMRSVPNSAYMTRKKAEEFLKRGNAYFVHKGEMLLGFGAVSGEVVEALGSVVPGAGQDVLLALNHALTGERICVEVATENVRAVKLYQRMGFLVTEELSVWYQII